MENKVDHDHDLTSFGFVPEECTFPTSTDSYNLLEQIGSGMGGNKVYKATVAEGPHKDSAVAVKQIMMNPSENMDELKEKMKKEIKAMRAAASPHICVFYCSILADHCLWVIMKLAAGSLRDVIKWKYKTGFPEEEETPLARVVYEALQGLDVLHKSNIIHRDIKASNILYGEDGVVTLADFGVSAILSNQEEKRQTMAGTWHWMAPEVIDPGSSGYDVRADIWSLGITTIELAYGEAPYANERPTDVVVHISTDQPPSMDNPHTPFFIKRKFSNQLADFVSLCLQVDPCKRGTTKQLMAHPLFNLGGVKGSDNGNLLKVLTENMPSIEKRFEIIQERRKEAAKIKFGTLGIGQIQRNNSRPGRPSKNMVKQSNKGKGQESSDEEGYKTHL